MRILLLTIYLLLSLSKSFGAIQATESKVLHHARIGIAFESQDKKSTICSLCYSLDKDKMDIDDEDEIDVQKLHFSKITTPIRLIKSVENFINFINFIQLTNLVKSEISIPNWQTANSRISPSSLYILNEVIRI